MKNVRTSETTIGGLPNADWREWAGTVKERPMPISYESVGLWELMTKQQANAYIVALQHIENIDLSVPESTPVLDAMHFGVARGSGEPLSSYSYDPNAPFRALLQVGDISTPIKSVPTEIGTVNGLWKASAKPSIFASNSNYYACGFNLGYTSGRINAIWMTLCNIHDWSDRTRIFLGKGTWFGDDSSDGRDDPQYVQDCEVSVIHGISAMSSLSNVLKFY